MTRETKIGLLVGLAFIIVIGVLLSDHIQTSTQPQPAILARSSESVDKSVAAPGKEHPNAIATRVPERVEPNGPVATSDHGYPKTDIVVTRGEATPASDIVSPPDSVVKPPVVADGNVVIGPGGSTGNVTPGATLVPGVSRNEAALKATVTVVPVDEPVVAPKPAADKKYKAAEGDSLYRITKIAYGKWSMSAQNLVLKANPQMGPDGKKIVIGQLYTIPALPTPAAPPAVASSATPGPMAPVPTVTENATPGSVPSPAQGNPLKDAVASNQEKAKPVSPVASGFRPYKVKEGDSLWKIANATGRAVAEIESANKDVLKAGKALKVGLVLKIPAEKTMTASVQ